jgi:hypothetical protein
MTMRRIKSAPANLAGMSNNKKSVNKKISIFSQENMSENKINIIKRDISMNNILDFDRIKFSSYNKFKSLKSNLNSSFNILSDAINEANIFNLEEYSIIYLLGVYLSENILKKDKFNEVFNFILITLIRYIVMLEIHEKILHENIEIKKNIITQFAHNFHLIN